MIRSFKIGFSFAEIPGLYSFLLYKLVNTSRIMEELLTWFQLQKFIPMNGHHFRQKIFQRINLPDAATKLKSL